MQNSDGPSKKLTLSKTTLRNLSVRTGIRTGISGPGCAEPTDVGPNCQEDDGDGGGGYDPSYTCNCPITWSCPRCPRGPQGG
jgi:hypothetical protein